MCVVSRLVVEANTHLSLQRPSLACSQELHLSLHPCIRQTGPPRTAVARRPAPRTPHPAPPGLAASAAAPGGPCRCSCPGGSGDSSSAASWPGVWAPAAPPATAAALPTGPPSAVAAVVGAAAPAVAEVVLGSWGRADTPAAADAGVETGEGEGARLKGWNLGGAGLGVSGSREPLLTDDGDRTMLQAHVLEANAAR